MNEIGHNKPPGMISVCDSVATDISNWLAEHPVIQNEIEAKEAKLQLDRGKLSLKDMEDERDGKVRPLNEQVKAINESYRAPKTIIGKVLAEIGTRIAAYIEMEERKRQDAAREAERIAAEAESRARAAEAAEREALESADTGELGVDLKARIGAADEAFREYEKASRQAQIAERETHVKITGGFAKASSLRKVKTYHIIDGLAALRALYPTDDLKAAILKAARIHYEVTGELPPGILMREERKI